jgi:hypothetical protein
MRSYEYHGGDDDEKMGGLKAEKEVIVTRPKVKL